MTSYNAANFSGVLNDSSISAENMENLVNVAINVLNMFGAATIPNMNSGAAGSKTVSLTSKQAGAVFLAVRMIYRGFWIGPKATGIAGMSLTEADVLANPTIVETIKLAAARLSSIAFKVAEDTSGIE
jgi:hypothetical protein